MPQHWKTSSYSQRRGNCVEVAATWHTSSYSGGSTGNCVEVAESSEAIKIRDTKHRALGHLNFPAAAWSRFLAELKQGSL